MTDFAVPFDNNEAGGVWAGVVPLRTVAEEPVTGADVGGIDVPEHVVERVRSLNE